MSAFKVEIGGMFTLANDLSNLAQTLDTESRVRGDYHGRSGSPDVDRALEGFFQHWSDGLNAIQQHLTALSTRVVDAVEAYEGTDHEIAEAATSA